MAPKRPDPLSPAQRSRLMGKVKSKDTQPELAVRRLVHSMGYRYRLHVKKLPGTPDLAFAKKKKVIFVNGCFWHRHNCADGRRLPRTRQKFWRAKLEGNKKRDRYNMGVLKRMGWMALTIWSCEIDDGGSMKKKILDFLGR